MKYHILKMFMKVLENPIFSSNREAVEMLCYTAEKPNFISWHFSSYSIFSPFPDQYLFKPSQHEHPLVSMFQDHEGYLKVAKGIFIDQNGRIERLI